MDLPRGRSHAGRLGALVVLVAALIASVLALTLTNATADSEIHLTAAGDYGARATTMSVLQAIADIHPDAHFALGDLAYTDAVPESAWCTFVKNKVGEGSAFELVSGNHESADEADGLINNYSACLPNQVSGAVGTYGREYYVDFPRNAPLVRVIATSQKLTFENGLWSYSQGDAHYIWLSNAIDDARAKGAKWVIVTGHIPCLSVGMYNCPSDKAYYDLLASKRVDLVLNGHEHAYMRTHQLAAGVTGCTTITTGSFNASCVADSDSSFIAGRGTVFATAGTGGTPLRDVNAADTEAGYFAAFEGANSNPTYGLLDIDLSDTQLSAHFVGTSGGNFTDAFTITKGAPNTPPVAAMTKQITDRTVTVNGSGSTDSDGNIVAYDWNFGDASTATGATPAPHTYAAAGTYSITLTVRDNAGDTNSITQSVTATDPAGPTTLATDAFTRTLASGWGTAATGGPWTLSSASSFAVNGTEGSLSTAAGGGASAYLRNVVAAAVDARVTLGSNKVATGSGLYLSFVGRSVTGAGDYRSVLRFQSDGRLAIRLGRTNAAGAETVIAPETIVAGVTYTPTDRFRIRLQVTGTSPTTARTKVWKVGTTEPAAWTLTTTDTTANLQGSGSTGLSTYLSGSATNAPIVLAVDDYLVTTP